MHDDITLAAAGTGAEFLGGLGTGGVAAVLTTALILGTRDKSEHQFSKGQAVTCGLAAGTVYTAAGHAWGVPDDITLDALHALHVGDGTGPLGDVQPGAVALVLVLVAYLVKLKPRAAGVNGLVMSTVFANAGGPWALIATGISDFFVGLAS
ncbi:hypothetical protein ABZ442_04945 [Streptomyces triculaminicus]|uniref:hypothetical protein n=1 Tax=Streptomyces triculaminicus TaxID=2816232 RepID=UPI0033EFC4AA